MLAWVPFVFAAIAYSLASARRSVLYVLIIAAAGVWLALLSQRAVHPHGLPPPRAAWATRPGWYDVLMLYWFAWTGLMLGVVSLYLMQEIVARGLGMTAGWVFVVVAAGLGSFGIYLGRFLRWNSWDIVRRPGPLADELPRPRRRSGLAAAPARVHTALRPAVPVHLRGGVHLRQAHQAAGRPREGLRAAGGCPGSCRPPCGSFTPAMTPGNIPRLIETLKAHAGDDKHIACEDAFRIARDLDVPLADVGRTCNELGIKVMQCQLGCLLTTAERAHPRSRRRRTPGPGLGRRPAHLAPYPRRSSRSHWLPLRAWGELLRYELSRERPKCACAGRPPVRRKSPRPALPGAREVRSMATVVPNTEVRQYQMYIDGRWTGAASGDTYDVVDPASEEVIARVPKAGVADAEEAVRAAREAFNTGPWPRMKAMERAEILNRAAALLRERAEDFARLESRQMGKLLEESRVDMVDAAHTFELYAGMIQTTPARR